MMNHSMIQSPRLLVVSVLLLALLPFGFPANTTLNFFSFVMIVTLAAQGWNLLAGFGGQFSFGHAAFFGMGAFGIAILQTRFGINAWLAFGIAILLGALVGFVLGFLSFRANLRGSYFALVTLAFAEVFRILANASSFTNGAAGILVPLKDDWRAFQFADKRLFYWIALALVALVMALSWRITRTRFGAQLVALRENEDAARALGIDTLTTKLKAITLSGAITAAAGSLYVQKFLYIDANLAFGPWISVEALLAPIIGGVGTVLGPLAGSVLLLGLGEVTKSIFSHLLGGSVPGVDLVVFGILLILAVGFAPRGVMGVLARLTPRKARLKGGEQ